VHGITVWPILRVLIVLGLLTSMVRGTVSIEQAGWLMRPVAAPCYGTRRRVRQRRGPFCGDGLSGYWQKLGRTWQIALLRSLLLWGLWHFSGQIGWHGWQLLPWVIWLLPDWGGVWRWLKRGLWQVQRMVLLVYLGMALATVVNAPWAGASWPYGLGIGCLAGAEQAPSSGEAAQVQVERQADGSYLATLRGHFTLRVDGAAPFRVRLLILFLGLLQSEGDRRGSRRTRDGRTPWVRQEQLAAWFGYPQECISRWMKYWLEGDWANLLSLKAAEVLTAELVERIVTVLATFPSWNSEQVYQHLHRQGVQVTHAQVEQAAEQSGWRQWRATWLERYEMNASGPRLREAWLLQQLLTQVQSLLTKLEAGQGLTPEERLPIADIQALAETVGLQPQVPFPARPWMAQVEQVLFGSCDPIPEAPVCCPECGSKDVKPKGKKPRWKKFYDQDGERQQVAVYRYFCCNPDCATHSFTHFPAGLLPYSPYRTQVHLLALQMYAWGYSTYRRTGTALGVYSMTVWRWVSEWGHDLLPVAALFGVVKSSGVVGVDEKYVLVPKNDKPAGDMRRWMYVYLAVDVWTYDLLHIAIYPYNDQHSAKAFLLALRTKGYHPRVIVTDLRQDYGPLIAQVFPQAVHHECIFHALQNVQQHVKAVYGANYTQEHPEAELLKQQIYAIFDTHSGSIAEQRYQQVLALKTPYLQATPASAEIFDFLERHWPKLVNAIGSDTIPTTNNTVELVIRRFDQHYQNFCGFDNIESTQRYLGVFEKVYRFTPFSQDAQPRIRGKSPLQLAGYDVAQLPMTAICAGLCIDWPTEVSLVPN